MPGCAPAFVPCLQGTRPGAFADRVIGCYDHGPFAAFLQFPVDMIRQDGAGLIARGFAIVDEGARSVEGVALALALAPALVPPRTIAENPFADLG